MQETNLLDLPCFGKTLFLYCYEATQEEQVWADKNQKVNTSKDNSPKKATSNHQISA